MSTTHILSQTERAQVLAHAISVNIPRLAHLADTTTDVAAASLLCDIEGDLRAALTEATVR